MDGRSYDLRCNMCWQKLDDTDLAFHPCDQCHVQICVWCFNKHIDQRSETCPKCRKKLDMV